MVTTENATSWKPGDTEKAKTYWAEYQRLHDLSKKTDQVAGIDPDTGRIWFGSSALDIWEQQSTSGTPRPLYYVRVGKEYYISKGGRR